MAIGELLKSYRKVSGFSVKETVFHPARYAHPLRLVVLPFVLIIPPAPPQCNP